MKFRHVKPKDKHYRSGRINLLPLDISPRKKRLRAKSEDEVISDETFFHISDCTFVLKNSKMKRGTSLILSTREIKITLQGSFPEKKSTLKPQQCQKFKSPNDSYLGTNSKMRLSQCTFAPQCEDSIVAKSPESQFSGMTFFQKQARRQSFLLSSKIGSNNMSPIKNETSPSTDSILESNLEEI